MSRLTTPRLMRDFVGTGMNSADIPVGAGKWTGSNPTSSNWGQQQPYIISSPFIAPAHPVYGSPAYNTALAEVRTISDTRTLEQEEIARRWDDSAGTQTAPGHWNEIAYELPEMVALPQMSQAKVLCYLNAGMMDAGIACWRAKYLYWLLRPNQADPAIAPPIGMTTPNFPSYTSGHATFSGAGSRFLALVFPSQAFALNAAAEEAALSRLYAGIHYRFDNDAGLVVGRSVGDAAFAAYQSDTLVTL